MLGFVYKVMQFGKNLEGLLPAVEILNFIGECSYSKIEGLAHLDGLMVSRGGGKPYHDL